MKAVLSLLLLLSALVVRGAEEGVLRFWWNRGDVEDGQINGIADRENFFPMLLDIRQFVTAWSGGGVAFRLCGNGVVNAAWTTISHNDVGALYRSDEVLAGESFGTSLDSAPTVQITSAGVMFRVFTTFDHCNKIMRNTDAKGYCEISGTTRGEITVVVDKDGYYTSYGNLRYRDLSWEDAVAEHRWTRGVVRNRIAMKSVVKPRKHLAGGMTLRPPPAVNELVPFDAFLFDWCSPYGRGIKPDFLIGCYDVTNAVAKRVRGVRILANHCVDGFVAARPDKWSKFRHALMADDDANYKREVRFGSVLGDDGVFCEGSPLHNGEYLIFRTRTETNEVGEVVRANYGLIEESLDYQSGLTLSIHVNPESNDKSLEHDKVYRLMKKGR